MCSCMQLRGLYEVLTNTAASLTEFAREAAPKFQVTTATGYSLHRMQQASHPGLMALQGCLACWRKMKPCVHPRWSTPPWGAHPLAIPIGAVRAPCVVMVCHGCSSRSALADPVLVASRAAPGATMGMTAKEARWLLSEFPPASARLCAEYRRLSASFSSAEARCYVECEAEDRGVLRPAALMAEARHAACPTSRAPSTLQSCKAEVCSAMILASLS